MKKLLIVLGCMLLLSSCAAPQKAAEYIKISTEEAKQMIDGDQSVLIVDVRTKEEYDQGHIKSAILLPNTEIKNQAAISLPDKDATILVYCRSGNRSKSASLELIQMGYTKVYDFGGIIDWSYDVVTE